MFLERFTRPWTITEKHNPGYFEVRDAEGKWIVNFVWYPEAVSSMGYITHDEAREAAQAFARLSRE